MVTDTRTPSRPDQLRPLNQPHRVTVLTQRRQPIALIDGERHPRVVHIQDVWCIDDEWWRERIARRYFQVVLETGALATIFHDLVADVWQTQRY
ncbi:MAG: hypothetical protein ACRDJW_04895 [Thermomicrobiales bacterium]